MLKKQGRSHPIHSLIQDIRDVFLSIGFDEVENRVFVPEDEVHRQYGKEAPVILDRVFYLAGLPRPDIGLSAANAEALERIAPQLDLDEFKAILRRYRAGKVESDALIETFVRELHIAETQAIDIIELFTEFKTLVPTPTKTTLRSHMTASWFTTLCAFLDKRRLPLQLFSIGLRFRREQRLDAHHLRAHYGASSVIMSEAVTLDTGKAMTVRVLNELGFHGLRFERKQVTSNYYETGTEYEVFSQDIEVADIGMYATRALRNYELEYPAFNLGFGLERLLMVRDGYDDVRKVLYPQFYDDWALSDSEIAASISYDKTPKTPLGEELAGALVSACIEHAGKGSPCKVLAWEGALADDQLRIYIVEDEPAKKLCGPALLNELVVKHGDIYGVPRKPGYERYFKDSVATGLRYIDAFAQLAAAEIEALIARARAHDAPELNDINGSSDAKHDTAPMVIKVEAKMIKLLSDINLQIDEHVSRYIQSNNKKIDVRGPMFVTVIAEVS